MENAQIWIVVLNWNRKQQTLDCLHSLMKVDYENFVVLVVDNGSEDGSPVAIREAYPNVEIIETGANLGYAGGNNVGIRRAISGGADYVLVLNNDTLVAENLLRVLVADSTDHADGAFFSPRIYHLEERSQISYAGGKWEPDRLVVNFITEKPISESHQNNLVTETEICHGCAIFFPRRTAEKIGLMDERFFLLFEETDWCFRARKSGMRCYVSHRGSVWHHGALSFGGEESPLRQYFHTRNFLLFGALHLSAIDFAHVVMHVLRVTFAMTPQDPAAGALANVKRMYWNGRRLVKRLMSRRKDPILFARWSGLRDFLLRRFGDCPAEIRKL